MPLFALTVWAGNPLKPPFHLFIPQAAGRSVPWVGMALPPSGSKPRDLVSPKAKCSGSVGAPRAIIWGPKGAFFCAYALQYLLGDCKDL